MKFLHTITFVFLLGGLFSVQAQDNKPFEKDYFPKEQKKLLKEAIDNIEEGDDYVEVDAAYHKALEFYFKAQKFNPHSAELNFKIGLCYLLSSNEDKTKALDYFLTSYRLNPEYNTEIHYYLARGYHMNQQWEKAIEEYSNYMSKHSNTPPIQDYGTVYKRIEECKVAKKLAQKDVRAHVEHVGKIVNSAYPDFGPIINADETVMMFTSRRPETVGGGQDDDYHYYEDIYITHKNEEGEWMPAKNMGEPVNGKFHDATVGLSPDGSRMLVYREGDLYECDLVGDIWSKPKKLNKNINTKQVETSASFSPDGNKLYFVSNREDLTRGGFDIFVSELDGKGEWGEPKNLGFNINTEYDEEGVFIHPDGRTMYFSSRGHENIGGYDIFKSTYSEKEQAWSPPINLGMPINTPDDDVFFVVNASGKRGYYASVRSNTAGEKDIYLVVMMGPEKEVLLNTEDNLLASIAQPTANIVTEKEVEIVSKNLVLFKGLTLDDASKNPIGANIEISDNSTGKVISKLRSNSTSGRFLVTLPAGKNYGIAVKAPAYLFHSENFDIPNRKGYLEVEKDVYLKKLEEGKKIVLRNIFFDFNKATIRTESERELENLMALLKENPSLRIEISGHTDSKGSDSYNQQLSEKRAKSVVDYLTQKGINASRLEFKGYGEAQPIDSNDTEEGRQNNRRTEFKVLK